MKKPKKADIYKSRRHLFTTLFVVVLPFLFFLFFTKYAHIASGRLVQNLSTSFIRLLTAYAISAFLAWILAISFYKGRRAFLALPIFDVLQSFPTFAALPIATYLWGASNLTVIFFLVITILWPILFSIVSTLKLIRHDWEEVVEIYELSGWVYIKNFLWPASVPGLITGSIIGLGEGWEALVATEIIAGMQNGLGNFFQVFSQNAEITTFGIIGFLILIFSINKLLWLPLLEWSHKKVSE